MKLWHAEPIDQGRVIGTLENVTQKIRIRNTLGGGALRVQFVNEDPVEPMFIQEVTLSSCDQDNDYICPPQRVTLHGISHIVVPPNSKIDSDVCLMSIHPTEDVIISAYFKRKRSFSTIMETWCTGSWDTTFEDGDTTNDITYEGKNTQKAFPSTAGDVYPPTIAAGICGVAIETHCEDAKTIACFGDSITHMSYYYSPLQQMVTEQFPGKAVMLNYGIGGNRVIYDATYLRDEEGHGVCFGPAGVDRFEESVYGEGTPEIVFIMEGINDCMHGLQFDHPDQVPTGAEIFEGLKKMLQIARKHGSKTMISTVLPFLYDPAPYDEGAERIRQELNALIRGEGPELADYMVDLAAVMDDPERPGSLIKSMQVGDGLHPNKEGGIRMAEHILPQLVELIKHKQKKRIFF